MIGGDLNDGAYTSHQPDDYVKAEIAIAGNNLPEIFNRTCLGSARRIPQETRSYAAYAHIRHDPRRKQGQYYAEVSVTGRVVMGLDERALPEQSFEVPLNGDGRNKAKAKITRTLKTMGIEAWLEVY